MNKFFAMIENAYLIGYEAKEIGAMINAPIEDAGSRNYIKTHGMKFIDERIEGCASIDKQMSEAGYEFTTKADQEVYAEFMNNWKNRTAFFTELKAALLEKIADYELNV